MMISRALIALLFFHNLNNTLAWDGCGSPLEWRCGDACINAHSSGEAVCKCGGEIFNHTAPKWCCNDKPCEDGVVPLGLGGPPSQVWEEGNLG